MLFSFVVFRNISNIRRNPLKLLQTSLLSVTRSWMFLLTPNVLDRREALLFILF
jgi:hypothetical protein